MDDPTAGSAEPDALALLPEVDARRLLAGRRLTFRLLTPPYVALGVGKLRVLRVVESEGAAELTAGYERYVRVFEGTGQKAGARTE